MENMVNERDNPHIRHRIMFEKSQFSKIGTLENTVIQAPASINKDKETKQTPIIVRKYKDKEYIMYMMSN